MDIRSAALIAYGFIPGDGPGWEQQEADQRERYEREVVDEARRILAGGSDEAPSREHLRVLLSWLDGRETQSAPAAGIPPEGVPF